MASTVIWCQDVTHSKAVRVGVKAACTSGRSQAFSSPDRESENILESKVSLMRPFAMSLTAQ